MFTNVFVALFDIYPESSKIMWIGAPFRPDSGIVTRVRHETNLNTKAETMTTKTPFIETTEYQFSHGRKPRGTGSWAFLIVDGSDNSTVETVFAPNTISFTAAKSWIKDYVRTNYAAELATGFLRIQAGT